MSADQASRHRVAGAYYRTVRSLPEHTVDCWVSSALLTWNPEALLWAPTQRGSDNWDMAFRELGGGKCLIFENKGTIGGYIDPHRHVVQIDIPQLIRYLRVPSAPVYYVVPIPPWRSSISAAEIDPTAPVPIPALCRTGSHCDRSDHGPHGPFETWAYVIEALDLLQLVWARRRWRPSQQKVDIPCQDFRTEPRAVDLRTFLTDLRACRRGGPRYENAEEAQRYWEMRHSHRIGVVADFAGGWGDGREASVGGGVLMAFVPIPASGQALE